MQNTINRPVSRRDAVIGTLAVGATLGLQPLRAQAPAPPGPVNKAVPGSGERLPAVGLGTDKFRTDAREAIKSEIKRMLDMGGKVIDTAAAYGDSEAIIGEVLATLGVRERVFLATKLTPSGPSRSVAGGEASLTRSLERLRTPRIDLLQVHNLDGVDELMPALQKWKRTGRVRYIGITTSRVSQHRQMLDYMRKYPLDFVQVDYSLANRDAAVEVLPLAMERKLGVLANVPFAFGSLFSRLQSRPLPDWARDIGANSWGQFLLKYVISHPAVTCTIPGSTQVQHLEDNQRAALGPLPDEATRHKMEELWDTAV